MAYRISNRLKYQVQTFIDNEFDRRLLYEALEKYEKVNDIDDLVHSLKKVLNKPERLRLFDIIRPLIIPQQQMDYNMLVPYISNRQRTLKLTRHKESAPFGFSIRGGREHGIGVFISDVVEGSTAFHRGLKVGDQIVRINGLSIDEAIHEEVLNLISKSKKSLVLKVKSVGMIPVKSFDEEGEFADETRSFLDALPPLSPTLNSPTSPSSTMSVSDADHYPLTYIQNRGRRKSLVSTTSSRRSEALSWVLADDIVSPEFKYASMRTNVDEIVEVKIFIDVSKTQKFGCSICMGPVNRSGIFIQSTTKGGIAEEVGLEAGDQIISANGIKFDKLSFNDAVKYLKSNKRVELVVRKRAGADLFTESPIAPTTNGPLLGMSDYNSENFSNLSPLEETKVFVENGTRNVINELRENHEEQSIFNGDVMLEEEISPIKNSWPIEPIKANEPISITPIKIIEPIPIAPVRDFEPIPIAPVSDIEPIPIAPVSDIEPIPIALIRDIEPIAFEPMETKFDAVILQNKELEIEKEEKMGILKIELLPPPPPPVFNRIDSEEEKEKRNFEKAEELKRQAEYASKLEAKTRGDYVVDLIHSAASTQRKSLALSLSEVPVDAPSLKVSPVELERLELLHQASIEKQNNEEAANKITNENLLKVSPKAPKRKDAVMQDKIDLTKLQSDAFDKFDTSIAPKPIRRKSVSFDLNESKDDNFERKISTVSSVSSSLSDRRQSIVVLAVKPTPHMFVDHSLKLDEVEVEEDKPKPQQDFRKKSSVVVVSPAKVVSSKKSITDSSSQPPKPPNFFFTKQSKLPNVSIGSYIENPPPRVSLVQPKIKIESKPISNNTSTNFATNFNKNVIVNNNIKGKTDINFKNKLNETKSLTPNKLSLPKNSEVAAKTKSNPTNTDEPAPVSSFSAARAKFMLNEINQNNKYQKNLQNGHSISVKTDQQIVIVKKN